jgi:hypothetical protein
MTAYSVGSRGTAMAVLNHDVHLRCSDHHRFVLSEPSPDNLATFRNLGYTPRQLIYS